MELFLNDPWSKSEQLALVTGRHLYRFEGVSRLLRDLRVDPTEATGARIRIYGVAIENHGQRIQAFSPAAIRNWSRAGLEPLGSEEAVADFGSVTDDPMLITRAGMDLRTGPERLVARIEGWLGGPDRIALLALLVFLAAGAFPWRGRESLGWPVLIPLVALSSVIVQRVLVNVLDRRLGGIPEATAAVGNATYLGYPKLADFRLYGLLVVVGTTLAFLAGRCLRRLQPPPPDGHPGPPRWPRAARVSSVLLLLALAVTSFPPLGDQLEGLRSGVHRPGWDEGNVFTWQYLVHRGWRPFRDFWYPYGGFSSFGAGGWFPWGYLVSWGHDLLLLAVAGWSLHAVLRRRPWAATMLVVLLVAGVGVGLLAAPGRYFLALDLTLAALAVRAGGYSVRSLLLLAALGVYALALEPNQLFYAGVPVLLLAGRDVWQTPGPERRALLRRLGIGVGAFAGGAGVLLLSLAVRGELRGFAGFLADMGVMTVYGSMPAQFRAWYRPDGNEVNVVLWGPLFLLAGGAAVAGWTRRLGPLVAAGSSLGLLGAMSFNKFLVRPHIASQIVVYTVVGLGLAALGSVGKARKGQQALALLLLTIALSGGMEESEHAVFQERIRNLTLLPQSLQAMLGGERRALELASYEDPRRYPDHRLAIERLQQLAVQGRVAGAPVVVFNLGDDSVFYAALGQRPPYYISIYNSSPLEAQQNTVDWLERVQPEWVVWRPSFRTFDAVPNVVRVPLIFDAVVRHYRPFERLGEFEILRRRAPGPADPEVDFWADRLGRTIELRAVPGISGLRNAATCHAPPCIDAVRVTVAQPVRDRERVLRLEVAGHAFQATFRELPGTHDYWIHLDRLWFHGALRGLGLQPTLSMDLGPAAKAERVMLSATRPTLW